MVVMLPFQGLRPHADVLVRSVAGSERGAERMARRRQHPRHVAWLEGGEDGPPAAVQDWIDDGSLLVDDRPRLRLVEQRLLDGHRVVGILGLARLSDLVPHEGTDSAAVRRRISRDRDQQVDSRPLLAVLPADPPGVATIVNDATARTPESELVDEDGIVHAVHVCNEAEAAQLIRLVEPLPCLLADGHHRAAAAAALGRTTMPTVVALSSWAPRMLPVWRIAAITRDGRGAVHNWIDGLGSAGDLEVHFDGRVARIESDPLELSVEGSQRVAQLIPGVQRITSTADLRIVAVAQRDGAVIVGSPPPSVTDVLEAVAAGRPLPPKSTAFHPKPRIGLVLHRTMDA